MAMHLLLSREMDIELIAVLLEEVIRGSVKITVEKDSRTGL